MSASKWPRIKWNQANARLANAPFENLFVEQERTMSEVKSIGVSALDDAVAKVVFDLSQLSEESWFAVVRRAMLESQEIGRRESAAELAQLRAELQAARERIAEQERQLREARYCITRRLRYHQNYPPVNSARWTDRENGIPGEDARNCDCDYCIEDRAWLAANPAPQEPQP